MVFGTSVVDVSMANSISVLNQTVSPIGAAGPPAGPMPVAYVVSSYPPTSELTGGSCSMLYVVGFSPHYDGFPGTVDTESDHSDDRILSRVPLCAQRRPRQDCFPG